MDLQHAYERFEGSKASGDVAAALESGRRALALTEAAPERDDRQLMDVLRSLGEVLAKAGQSTEALQDYERALALQEGLLGADHPDLVPTLEAIAQLQGRLRRNADVEATLERILGIERSSYGEHSDNVVATLQSLRELYVKTARTADVARMDAAIEKATASARTLELPLDVRNKDRRYRQANGFATVRVFYGTNRAPTGELKPALYYGPARGDLRYGYVEVSIPEVHQQGELETQPRWSLYTYLVGEEALKRHYVLLEKTVPLGQAGFNAALRKEISEAPSKDVFIFVHGFNTSFEDAARRTAQLAYDLDFDGTPLMYSWPSQASTTAYTVDEAAVEPSGRKMAEFLEDVASQSGAAQIHLIAHSMGNRALIEALRTYLANHAAERHKPVFGQIVFTAPDVDREWFIAIARSLEGAGARVTLYASNNDLALKTSQAIHGAPRAGLAGSDIITLRGLDTIDMSSVHADLLGHNYYAADTGAIYDLFRLLWRGDPPPRRCGMSDRLKGAATSFWLFDASACKGFDLLEAGVLVKRFGERARARVIDRIALLTDPSQKQEWSRILTRLDGLLNARDNQPVGE
jgi:esterase/lipase superfamily enzyme